MLTWCHVSISLRHERHLPANAKKSRCNPLAMQSCINCSNAFFDQPATWKILPANTRKQLSAKTAILSQYDRRFDEHSWTKCADLAKTQTITVYKCFNAAISRSACDMKDICKQTQRRAGAPLSQSTPQSFINVHMVAFLDQPAIWKTIASSKHKEAVVCKDGNSSALIRQKIWWTFLQEVC